MKKPQRGGRKRQRSQLLDPSELLREQFEVFEKKFGRPPRQGDPIFFDPDADEPRQLSIEELNREILSVMRASDVPPQIIYAFKKTGMILSERLKDEYPAEKVATWEAAIDEYFALEAKPEHSDAARGESPSEHPTETISPKNTSGIADEHERMAKALGLEGEEFERYVHSFRHPGFVGTFTFDMIFELFGERIRRKARVAYQCTPSGEYYDLKKKALFEGWGHATYAIELRGWEYPDNGEKRKAAWVASDVNDVFLTEKLSDKIFDLITEECKKLDAERRRKARLPLADA